jgi:hypothetical protein
MIAQGTDDLSRGFFLEGVLAGKDMLSLLDLSLLAIRQYPKVLDVIQLWMEPIVGKGRVLKEEE